ncbi:MAG: copper resistance protein NlpE N-terminal domain-containing protein [Pseudohaliea sp.]
MVQQRLFLPLILLMSACAAGSPEPTDPSPPKPDPAHNSRLSLDWDGTYRGILPCADCPGIETVITLTADGTYLRAVRFLEREDGYRRDQGEFEWNAAGSAVTLGDGEGSQRYQVGEDRLFFLDRRGQRIAGELAENYVLVKDLTDPRLESRDWVLTELMGKPVSLPEGQPAPSLRFDPSTGRVSGSDGCNRLMGSYRLLERDRIEFGQLAGTLMACPDMTLPDRFREVLGMAGDYAISDGELSLFKGRMAILARFRASPAATE